MMNGVVVVGNGLKSDNNTDGNDNNSKEGGDALDAFRKDEVLCKFLDPEFDVTVFTSLVINQSSKDDAAALSSSVDKINSGIKRIEKELYSQVVGHHEDLIKQVSNIKELESMLDVISKGVNNLQGSIGKIKNDITEPYLSIKSKTIQLDRLQIVSELLRKILRFLFVANKLKKHLNANASRELPKSAQCLYELETIRKEADLSGIEVIDTETRWIVKASEEVVATASRMLTQGLDSLNQTEMATALQVFYYMKMLQEKVASIISSVTDKVNQSITTVLNVNVLNEDVKPQQTGSTPSTGTRASAAAMRTALWSRMEKLVDTLHTCCVQIWHLQRVLAKMRDPTTHACLLDELIKPGESSIFRSFWKNLTTIVAEKLAEASKSSTIIENAFVNDYPKLLRLFQDFLRRLQTHYEIKQTQTNTVSEEQTMLLKSLHRFETAYLGRCVSKLSEPINLMFARSAPLPEDVNSYAKTISAELEASLVDPNLTQAVGKTVVKSLRHFLVHCENLTVSEAEAYQVTEAACNSSQLRNANIFTILNQMHSSMSNLTQAIPPNAQEIIADAVNSINAQASEMLVPLFEKLKSILEKTIFSMHAEDYNSPKTPDTQPEAKYLKLLQHQINNFTSVIMAPFPACASLTLQYKALATWLVTTFLRSSSLVRPLSEAGRLRLAGELGNFEHIVSFYPIKELGQPYKMLRAFKPLLFQPTDKIATCPEAKVLLPSYVLHHLLSRGPVEMQSPAALKGWTLANYCSWMNERSEEEIWAVIKQSLEIYAQKVNARGEREYAVVYPIILALGPKLLENFSVSK